jgi:hypothetical protein
MPLDRVIDRFERSEELAMGTARVQLDMVLVNEEYLLRIRGGFEKLKAAKDFDAMLKRGESLTPGQLSFVEGIYEAMWRGAGYTSINVHHDKPKGQLRHPR